MSLPHQVKDGAGEETPSSPADLLEEVKAWTLGAYDAADSLREQAGSRELSLVITKIEEAQMWLERVTVPAA